MFRTTVSKSTPCPKCGKHSDFVVSDFTRRPSLEADPVHVIRYRCVNAKCKAEKNSYGGKIGGWKPRTTWDVEVEA